MLIIIFSGAQTPTKAITQFRDTNGKNELEEETKEYLILIFRTIRLKEGIGREWKKFEQNQQNLVQAKGFATMTGKTFRSKPKK